ncbi:Ankyrin-1 [Trichoderma lentiforme]|uniref:Ankyrin-1 n=1 Tax=Trichoderma lentiforme TaxID=1567552 RepID=A0A9P4X7Y7_9HYPO|nr:Ankyrin-1 [Trichoderma lentiforme]
MAAPVASEAGISAAQAVAGQENSREDAVADEPNEGVDEAKFDIIGVHGFHGDENIWDGAYTSSGQDPTRLNRLFSNIAPKGGRFISYSYDPDEASMGCYTLQGSYRNAHKLLEVVAKSRTPEIRNARRPIYFACHDIGGVIVKTALIIASLDESAYADILHCIRGIIFFGYPHRSTTIVDLEEQLFWLLSLNNDCNLQGHKMTLVKSLAETISKVNDSFIHTKMLIQARVINVFSTHDDPTKKVFDKFTATLGVPLEYRLPSVKPHLQLFDPEELDSYAEVISPDEDWLEFKEVHNASLRKSLHQASPIYPALSDTPIEYNPELDILSKTNYNHILHIQCTSDAGNISESVKSYLSEAKSVNGKLYYFRFKSHDARFNTIPAMLWTFFAQSVYRHPRNFMINSYFPEICDGYSWGYRCLLHMWQNVVVRSDGSNYLLVLGCLDECDDTVLYFLSEIYNYFTTIEHHLRIVIITTKGTAKDKLIVDTLSKFPTESITRIDYNLPSSEPRSGTFNVSMLLQQSHYYAVNDLRDKIEALLSGCANDVSLRHLLINCFRSTPDLSKTVSRILAKSQTPSPEQIFESILEDIPEEYHLWANKLLCWMLSSFRPLRASEFCRISDLCLGNNLRADTGGSTIHGRFINIIRRFGGLLVTVHDEVHFSHASIRGWLKSSDSSEDQLLITKGWYRQTERDRHTTIVQTCLDHLKDDTDHTQAWIIQLPYVTEFRMGHRKQFGSIGDALWVIFKDQPVLERWVDAYMALPTPFLKPLKNRKWLTIASHFGFEGMVKSILASNEYDSETLNQSLVEAARMAQLPVFRLLMNRYPDGLDLSNTYVQAALQAALRSENYELCHELVNRVHLSEQPSEINDGLVFNYPDNHIQDTTKEEAISPKASNLSSCLKACLRSACELDMTDIVAKLLSFGPENDTTFLESISDTEDTPLLVTAQYSRLDSAKLLIAAGASVTPNDNKELAMPLEIAASYGSSEMTDLLLSHGAPIDAKGLSNQTSLETACVAGNFAAVESLLRYRDFRDYITLDLPAQPLMIAVQEGHYKIAEALLRHGADPDFPEQDGQTALWLAVVHEWIDICRLLLAHKADPNLALKDNRITPLISAIINKNMELVKVLIKNGADVNQPLYNQCTPVYMATFGNDIEIVRYLLSHNADPNIASSNGITPLWLAAQQGYSEVARLLAEAKADVHATDNSGWTPLHAVYDTTETVRVLLEYGADMNRMNKKDATPLGLAINSNQVNAVKLMLSESKIKPDWSIPSMYGAIQHAVRDGYNEVMSLVLEAGANVNLVDDHNASLALWAMSRNDDDMIRTLLEFGPDLSHKDKDGDTALHNIRKTTPLASIRRVVNAGGKLDAMNDDLETPLISAIRACNMEVFDYFMTKPIIVDTLNSPSFSKEGAPLHFACARGTIDMVKVLIKNGADINYACASAYGTPLIAATRRRGDDSDIAESIIGLLLDEGADSTISAGRAGYPIISASISCSPKVIQLLLNHKASVDVKDPFGRKPAHFACHNTLEVLKSLNLPDSDFAARDIVGRVPLHYAVIRGQIDLVEEVLARSQRVGIGIDVVDDDGWTPLLWAARAPRLFFWRVKLEPSQYDAMVSFLLSKGANPSIRGHGLYKDWTVSEVAYYHHADSIADLVADKTLQKNKRRGPKKRGKKTEWSFCDCCYAEIAGIYFRGPGTLGIELCFKCYRSKSRIAPGDEFIDCGYDFDEDDEEADTESKAAQSVNGEIPVKDQENVEIQFDDEVVEEEDMEL